MSMVDFTPPIYEPQSTDVYYTPMPGSLGATKETVSPVNLSALTYYARLGMKPARIAVLVKTNHNSIWKTPAMHNAYLEGAAHHELWLRSVTMEATKFSPMIANELLNRSVGQAAVDVEAGIAPADRIESKPVQLNINVESTVNDPAMQEIKDLLKTRIEEASKKAK